MRQHLRRWNYRSYEGRKTFMKQTKSAFQNATGKIDYTMTNDYMFRAVLQENKKVLIGLICALLHLDCSKVKSVVILNPIEKTLYL